MANRGNLKERVAARRALAKATDVTTGTFLERLATIRGDRRLVSEPGGWSVTYAEAADLLSRAAGTVAAKIQPGDRVLVATPNAYRLFLACLAVGRAGGVAVPVNPKMTDDEIGFIESDAGTALRIDDFDELLAAGPGPIDAVPREQSDVAVLLYTSGTTGRPKGAELTHRAVVGGHMSGAMLPERLLGRGALTGMPVAHIAGFSVMVQMAAMGMPLHYLPRFRPTDALDAIETERPMMVIGVPMMFRMMQEVGLEGRDLSSVRVFSSGADALPTELAEAFQEAGATLRIPVLGRAVGKATFIDGYGMVELGGGVAVRLMPPIPLPIGGLRAMGANQLKVVDDQGDEVPDGEVGELVVKGPTTMRGYHGRDEATAEATTADGWLRTGDLARRGRFGAYQLAGRKKDVVKVGGYSVFAVEVERALEAHPDVLEAAVLGKPDARRGEVPVAAVRLTPGSTATPEDVIAAAKANLSDYKVPVQVVVVDELPRTGTEKVKKRDLLPLFVT